MRDPHRHRNASTRRSPRRRGWLALRRALGYAGVALLAACAPDDVESELDRARSWTATTSLAADRFLAGATNRAVTTQLHDRAVETRSEVAASLRELAHSDADRAAARGVLDSLSHAIGALEQAAR